MKKILILMLLTVAACSSQDSSQNEQANNTGAQSDQMSGDVARWEAQAKNITIIRDD